MKNGHEFDVIEDTLNKWYVEIQYNLKELNERGQITDMQYHNTELEIGALMREQYKIYGHLKENPLYLFARLSLNMIAKIVHENGFLDTYAYLTFTELIHFTPDFRYYNDRNFIPLAKTWMNVISKTKDYLISRGALDTDITTILSKITPIIEELVTKINVERGSQSLIDDTTKNIRRALISALF